MINFNSPNLEYKIYKSDDIDISNHIDSSTLNHIFSKYFYYKYNDTLHGEQYRFYFDINDNSVDDILNDTTIGDTLKLQILYYIVQKMIYSNNIFILINVRNINKLYIILDNICIDNITDYNAGAQMYEYTTAHTENISGINVEFIGYLKRKFFDVGTIGNDDIITSKLESSFHMRTIYQNNNIANIGLIDKTVLTQQDITNFNNNNFVYTNYRSNVINDKFAIKLKFLTITKIIIFRKNSLNYVIIKNLIDILHKINTVTNDNMFSYSIMSWFKTTNFSDTYLLDIHSTTSTPLITTITLSTTFDHIDTDVYNYLYAQNNDSNIILQQNIEAYATKVKYITRIDNIHTKQYEYFDTRSPDINNSIGSSEFADLLEIVGYDQTTNEYIILYISKNIEVAQDSFIRTYKLIRGGILPINNNTLINKCTYTFSIMQQRLISNYFGIYDDILQLSNHVHSTTIQKSHYMFTKQFTVDVIKHHYNNISDIRLQQLKETLVDDFTYNILYNDTLDTTSILATDDYQQNLYYKVVTEQTNMMLLKLPNTNIVSKNIQPYYTIMDLLENGITNDISNIILQKYFTRIANDATQLVDSNDYIFYNLFSKNYAIIDKKFISYIDQNDTTKFTRYYNSILLNKLIVNSASINIDNVFKTNNIIDYTFINGSDILSDDTISDIFDINNIFNNIDTTNYDIDDTAQCNINPIISELVDMDIYDASIPIDHDNDIAMCIFNIHDIMNTQSKILILNKTIGFDQQLYWRFKTSNDNDLFNDFIFTYIDRIPYIYVYINFSESTVNVLSPTDMSFDISTQMNSIIVNKDDLHIKTIFKFDKSKLPTLYDNFHKMKGLTKYIGTIDYSNKIYTNDINYVHNLYNNDIVMIR